MLAPAMAYTSAPLRFNTLQSFSRDVSWTIGGYGLKIEYGGSLSLETVSIVTTIASYDYAEKEKSSILSIEINNQPTTITVKGYLYVDIAGVRVGAREIILSSAINSQIGRTEYSWGSIEIFSATYGMFEITIVLTSKIAWQTQATSSLTTSGPVAVSPSSISWTTSTQASTTASFADDKPVHITLSNPTLILADMKLLATFSGILKIAGLALPIAEKTVTLVDLPYIKIMTTSTKLIAFEPNYFKLYTELSAKYSQLLTSYQELSASINALNNEVATLNSKIKELDDKLDTLSLHISRIQTDQILSWIAIFIGVIAIAISGITFMKKREVKK